MNGNIYSLLSGRHVPAPRPAPEPQRTYAQKPQAKPERSQAKPEPDSGTKSLSGVAASVQNLLMEKAELSNIEQAIDNLFSEHTKAANGKLAEMETTLNKERENGLRLNATLEAERAAYAKAALERPAQPDHTPWFQKILDGMRPSPAPRAPVDLAPQAPIEPPSYEMTVVGRDINDRPQRILLTPRKDKT